MGLKDFDTYTHTKKRKVIDRELMRIVIQKAYWVDGS